jgi:hypothetical protein
MKSLPRKLGFVLALGASALSCAALRDDATRLDTLRARADRDCAAYRARPGNEGAGICGRWEKRVPIFPLSKSAQQEVSAAREALDRGAIETAVERFIRALDLANEIDREKTFVSLLGASAVRREVVSALSGRIETIGARRVADILDHVPETLHEGVMERERVHALWFALDAAQRKLWLKNPIARSLLADELMKHDARFAEMNRAILEGDEKRCEALAAERPSTLWMVALEETGIFNLAPCAPGIREAKVASDVARLRREVMAALRARDSKG